MQFFFKAGINNLITSRVMHLSISTPPPVPPPPSNTGVVFENSKTSDKFPALWEKLVPKAPANPMPCS